MRISYSCLTLAIACGSAWAYAGIERAAIDWKTVEEIAVGRGEKGEWQQNESRYDYVDDPTVDIDDQGGIALAWVDQARKDVFFQRIETGGKNSAAINVSGSPETFSWLPRIELAPDNPEAIYMIWQEIIFSGASHGGEMFFARSTDGGKSFNPPINISHSFGGDGKGRINKEVWHNGSYDLAVAPDGGIHVAWTEYDGMLWSARSNDGGKSFSKPQHIAGSRDSPARAPALAVDGKGLIYLAWTTGENEGADILITRSEDKGATFARPKAVAQSPTYSDAPKLAVDAKDRLHLAFAESDGGPFGNYHVRYTRSFDGARSFEAPRNLSLPMPSGISGAAFPSLAVAADGKIVLTWELYPRKSARPRGLGIAWSRNGGDRFSPPGIVPHSADPDGGGNGSHQGLLMKKLAVNDQGAIAVVNSSLLPGLHSRVWLMRGSLAN